MSKYTEQIEKVDALVKREEKLIKGELMALFSLGWIAAVVFSLILFFNGCTPPYDPNLYGVNQCTTHRDSVETWLYNSMRNEPYPFPCTYEDTASEYSFEDRY